jgi:glycosyltransferase involved in cell wall biosynthesis
MRIALVTHQFFPSFYTGVERLTLNLASQLGRMGHVCVVVTSEAHSDGGRPSYPYANTWVRTVAAGETDLARPWLQDRRVVERLTEILREERTDVVHVMHPMRLPQAFETADRLDVPVVAHLPDFGYFCARLNLLRVDGSRCPSAALGAACVSACGIESGPERYAWGKALLARSAAVVSPCRWTIERHAAEGFDTLGWEHVPWGVDYALHPRRLERPAGDELVLGFIGTLLRHKGPHVVIEALQLLADRPIRLLLYGGSFHEKEYERELRRLAGDDERIVFAGSYDHAELPTILAGLDAVVIPSVWFENLPTTGLNAVAAGVPVLAADVPGLRELVDDYDCGFTYAADDAGALAALLRDLCEKRELLDEARSALVLPPSLEEEAFRIESIYLDVLSARAGGASSG